jgi:hypothetical protein
MIKKFENVQMLRSNKLKFVMKEANVLDFGGDGKVTWKANAKGSRVFQVRVKVDDDYVLTDDPGTGADDYDHQVALHEAKHEVK